MPRGTSVTRSKKSRSPSRDQQTLKTEPASPRFVRTVQSPEEGFMTATWERPATSVRNARALPSGELRGDITRVMGPTRRLPFQIGAGASTCWLAEPVPSQRAAGEEGEPEGQGRARSPERGWLFALAGRDVGPRGPSRRRWGARRSAAPAIGDFVVGSGGGASWAGCCSGVHVHAARPAARRTAGSRRACRGSAGARARAPRSCRSARRDPSRGSARSPSEAAAARGRPGRRAAAGSSWMIADSVCTGVARWKRRRRVSIS